MGRIGGGRRNCTPFAPRSRLTGRPGTTKAPDYQGFREIGETGFEPATARPPAGTFWLSGVELGGVERLRVGRSWPQLRSLCTPDCTPSDEERDQHPPGAAGPHGCFRAFAKVNRTSTLPLASRPLRASQASERRRPFIAHSGSRPPAAPTFRP